ncbi:unnamed protein product [Vitrella brassicaformis CCMP3155]|uniref:Mitochondrial import inner membrane translocase subunit n=1 Tax=Vitrella brassicaformis (strain CCMP3155) TaxID=1169540 RepID=A0A0G4H1N2_VITBC|nr:unnamed protein product [Vitrella brassicaformis CCMP3155]|mmetsp:Transcript_20872/g.59532  ORF Transcript_20872/g.59532 Transcript_20872/m.59532 type:complete len:98 (-) Transcript_20872:984-1277(-)|eukprot:CEM37409.1 unnamed protein product [Vitrella brassicaformis CCMP3155]
MSGSAPTEAQQIQQLQAVQAIVESQKTIAKLTGHCFERCVGTPGRLLSSGQQTCIWNCAQRYIETNHFIKLRTAEMIKATQEGGGGVRGGADALSGT